MSGSGPEAGAAMEAMVGSDDRRHLNAAASGRRGVALREDA
jgi:hypothetical protein